MRKSSVAWPWLQRARASWPNRPFLLERAANAWPEDEIVRTYWAAALAASGDEERALEIYQSVVNQGEKLGQLARRQMETIKRRRIGTQREYLGNPTVMTMN